MVNSVGPKNYNKMGQPGACCYNNKVTATMVTCAVANPNSFKTFIHLAIAMWF